MSPVVVSGASGRLGQSIAARLGAAGYAVRPKTRETPLTTIEAGTILVECAPRAAALAHLARAAEQRVPALIASTGFDTGERKQIDQWAEQIPILLAPNLSLGVALMTRLVGEVSAALPGWDFELVELHHNQKRDAPSGTALALGEAGAAARGLELDRVAICARAGETGPRGEREIGLFAVRGGDTVGEHTAYFFGAGERIELTHRAFSRGVFAEGALAAVRFLERGPKAGLYGMSDILAVPARET